MPTPLPIRFGDIVLLPSHKQQDTDTSFQFRDPEAALDFLRSLDVDSQTTTQIRKILTDTDPRTDVARMMNTELLTTLARHVASGRIVIGMRRRMRGGGGSGGGAGASSDSSSAGATSTSAAATATAAPAPAPPPSAATVAAAAAAEAAQADDAAVDAEAQAAVLQQAAESGVPFCEECEKRKKQREAAAADGPQDQAA
ncbi:MAG: hypothetical protein JWM41_2162 [Gemmatimonadetes bacterium]|nr:hypothetical protein [Gemmatimonadota bacterium]